MASYAFFFLFIALNVADILTTRRVLALGGSEANPVMRWCIERLGYGWGLVLPKLAMIPALYLVLLPVPPAAPYIVGALCAGYALLIAHNIKVIRKLK